MNDNGSKFSFHAYKVALDIAKKYNSKLTVVTCIERAARRGFWYSDPRIDTQIVKMQSKAAKTQIAKLDVLAKKEGVSISSNLVETSSIVKSLVDFVKTKEIDLVVIGSHGRTGVNKLILGSVANGVSQQVRSPVLIVR